MCQVTKQVKRVLNNSPHIKIDVQVRGSSNDGGDQHQGTFPDVPMEIFKNKHYKTTCQSKAKKLGQYET